VTVLKISKAVIPAAGLGTRFLPATKSMPKEMLPIIDKPVIHYVVEEAISAGIDNILIITGRGKRAIEDYFDTSPELENLLKAKSKITLLEMLRKISTFDIHYIRQKEPCGLGDAILKAEKHIGDEPFAVLLGDDMIASDTPAIKQLIDSYESLSSPIIGVEKVSLEEISKYGIVEVTNKLVKNIIEKPIKTNSNLAIIGRYILTPEIFDCIRKVKPGYGGEIQLSDALNLQLDKTSIHIKEIQGKRYDIGDKLNYIKAIIDFSLERDDLNKSIINHINSLKKSGKIGK
jgi:UTP--glucose-1-phosphate uridylyltransferase